MIKPVNTKDRFVTFREGCERLGISRRTAHRLHDQRKIPEILTVGGRCKFRESDIDRFIETGRVGT